MFNGVVNMFFEKWFMQQERDRSGNPNWLPPTPDSPHYPEYVIRREAATAAWSARGDYPLMTKKAISLPEEMYMFLKLVRDARQTEINKDRPPAIQRDLFCNAVRSLGDYLIRHDIAGSSCRDEVGN